MELRRGGVAQRRGGVVTFAHDGEEPRIISACSTFGIILTTLQALNLWSVERVGSVTTSLNHAPR